MINNIFVKNNILIQYTLYCIKYSVFNCLTIIIIEVYNIKMLRSYSVIITFFGKTFHLVLF